MKKIAASAASLAVAVAALASGTAVAKTNAHAAAVACPANPIVFAVEPYDNPGPLEKAYSSLASDLQQKLGCTVKLTVTDSYVAEIEAMKAGHIQIGEFGPLGYVLAHQIADAQPVAAFGDADGKPDVYTAGIYVKKGSGITSLKQLSGKTIALSSSTSTSGGLYPLSALIDAGFKCTAASLSCQGVKVEEAGSHPAALEALVHGSVDAAEVNSQTASSAVAQKEWVPSQYTEIWKSTPIINDPVTVYGKLPAAFKTAVTQALLSLTKKQTSAVDTELGTANNGPMVKATDSLYNKVRAVANSVHLTTAELG